MKDETDSRITVDKDSPESVSSFIYSVNKVRIEKNFLVNTKRVGVTSAKQN